jgi:outer membrane lipoprotein LolB
MLSLALAACATRPVQSPPLSADQQRNLLQDLAAFSFTGRVAITGQDPIPSLQWQQQRDVAKVKLAGPLGAGMQVEYSPGSLRVVTSRGVKLDGGEAEETLANQLGFVPPFDSLRYWILGVPAPHVIAEMARDDSNGLLQSLQQQGWQITYDRRMAVQTAAGTMQLPARLVATRDKLQLRLVIDRWHIK